MQDKWRINMENQHKTNHLKMTYMVPNTLDKASMQMET